MLRTSILASILFSASLGVGALSTAAAQSLERTPSPEPVASQTECRAELSACLTECPVINPFGRTYGQIWGACGMDCLTEYRQCLAD